MGLFGAIKAFFALRKNLAKELEAIREREARYPAMTTDELAALDDEELFEAVNVRTENKVDSFEELTEGFHSLNDSQKVFYNRITTYNPGSVNSYNLSRIRTRFSSRQIRR